MQRRRARNALSESLDYTAAPIAYAPSSCQVWKNGQSLIAKRHSFRIGKDGSKLDLTWKKTCGDGHREENAGMWVSVRKRRGYEAVKSTGIHQIGSRNTSDCVFSIWICLEPIFLVVLLQSLFRFKAEEKIKDPLRAVKLSIMVVAPLTAWIVILFGCLAEMWRSSCQRQERLENSNGGITATALQNPNDNIVLFWYYRAGRYVVDSESTGPTMIPWVSSARRTLSRVRP